VWAFWLSAIGFQPRLRWINLDNIRKANSQLLKAIGKKTFLTINFKL
jgi:hypothetical protein